jgi:hypothetical protein
MQTFALNALAETLEVDRGVMVRAMRGVPPDQVRKGNRPTWRIATAAKALEAHRAKQDGGGRGGSGIPPTLQALYDKRDRLEDAMRALPELEQRREAARAMIPIIIETDRATRQNSLKNGHESDIVHLRADAILRLYARGIEGPCEWSHDDVWMMFLQAEGGNDD